MIPVEREFVKGYYLVNNYGDLYCFGDIPFPGTVKTLFNSSEQIVSVDSADGGIILTSKIGEVMTLAQYPSKIEIPNSDHIIDSLIWNGKQMFFCFEGSIIDKTGEVFVKLNSNNTFVAFCLDSSKDHILATTTSGDVHIVDLENKNIEIKLNDLEHGGIVGIECLPWDKGYWLIDNPGGIFCFDNARYYGSVPQDGHRAQACDVISSPSGNGYWIIDKRGMVLPFGDAEFHGFPKPKDVTGEIVSMYPVIQADRNDRNWLFSKLVQKDISSLSGEDSEFFPEPIAENYL